MNFSPLVNRLIEALRCMPGVGRKSAQRIAFYLLDRDREGARAMAAAISEAMQQVRHCERCRMFSEDTLCQFCLSKSRDNGLICVVESPADVIAIEQTGRYRGRYFVLMGHLSPLDGIGPSELGLQQLDAQLANGGVREVILATNPTVEGDATAYLISETVVKYDIKASRIAHGVPIGGELEYVDSGTIAHALSGRQVMR